jgi:hypothetical protein
MFKIERDIPIPDSINRHRTKYPWVSLGVGESFFVPNGNIANLRSSASVASARLKKKFFAGIVKGGVRIWREG